MAATRQKKSKSQLHMFPDEWEVGRKRIRKGKGSGSSRRGAASPSSKRRAAKGRVRTVRRRKMRSSVGTAKRAAASTSTTKSKSSKGTRKKRKGAASTGAVRTYTSKSGAHYELRRLS